MWFFERCDNEDDFGHPIHTPVYEQIWCAIPRVGNHLSLLGIDNNG